jgi:hypothetical protein
MVQYYVSNVWYKVHTMLSISFVAIQWKMHKNATVLFPATLFPVSYIGPNRELPMII